jgi:hypothetical protein
MCRCGQDDLLKFKLSIRMGKKDDLSDFERCVVVGARRAGLSISEMADPLGFSRATISRVYREWSEKEEIGYQVSGSSVGENALLMPEVRGEWQDWFELIERQQ